MPTPAPRPQPLQTVATKWATVYATCTAIISGLVTAGVISAGQAGSLDDGFSALDLLLSAVVAVVGGTGAVLAAFTTAKNGAEHVTPISDPVVVSDGQLIPLVPAAPRVGQLDTAGGL